MGYGTGYKDVFRIDRGKKRLNIYLNNYSNIGARYMEWINSKS